MNFEDTRTSEEILDEKVQILTEYVTEKEFPEAKDRSKDIIYTTTFMDGRTLCIAGPKINLYVATGKVTMRAAIRMRDGSRVGLRINTDGDGDNIEIKSLLRSQIRPMKLCEQAWNAVILSSELNDLNEDEMKKLAESICELADDFLASIKPIVNFRKMTYEKIKVAIASSPF